MNSKRITAIFIAGLRELQFACRKSREEKDYGEPLSSELLKEQDINYTDMNFTGGELNELREKLSAGVLQVIEAPEINKGEGCQG